MNEINETMACAGRCRGVPSCSFPRIRQLISGRSNYSPRSLSYGEKAGALRGTGSRATPTVPVCPPGGETKGKAARSGLTIGHDVSLVTRLGSTGFPLACARAATCTAKADAHACTHAARKSYARGRVSFNEPRVAARDLREQA